MTKLITISKFGVSVGSAVALFIAYEGVRSNYFPYTSFTAIGTLIVIAVVVFLVVT